MPSTNLSDAAERLISHLSYALNPADRRAFREAAEAALMAPGVWGEGRTHRTLTRLWRDYFHPPSGHRAHWDICEDLPRFARSRLVNSDKPISW